MPFREKIAWIAVVTMLLVWGSFFGALLVQVAGRREAPGHTFFTGFAGAVAAQVALMVAASIVTAMTAPSDAGAARDERDREITRRARALAYPVLVAAVVLVAASMHLGNGRIGMAYGIMAAIVVAELVQYGAQIAGYRTGWHG